MTRKIVSSPRCIIFFCRNRVSERKRDAYFTIHIVGLVLFCYRRSRLKEANQSGCSCIMRRCIDDYQLEIYMKLLYFQHVIFTMSFFFAAMMTRID